MRHIDDITGKIFGDLTVICLSPDRKYNRVTWNCLCKCGKSVHVTRSNMIMGLVRSCGCLRRKLSSERRINKKFPRGGLLMSSTPEYKCWAGIIKRCYNKMDASYSRYGAKGISVCNRWKSSFVNFYEDMGPKPSPKHTIDRIKNDKGYSPSNCRWATGREQMLNRGGMHPITFNGVTKKRIEWAEDLGITSYTLRLRLLKWPFEKAMTTRNLR